MTYKYVLVIYAKTETIIIHFTNGCTYFVYTVCKQLCFSECYDYIKIITT